MGENNSEQFILENMPYPIAHLYAEMLAEKDSRIRFRELIKVFASTLKYISLICIADYLKKTDSSQVNTTLSRSLSRPSLGHWMQFLRSIINYYNSVDREFLVKEMKLALNKKNNRVIDHLIHLRNTYVHPDILPDQEESGKLYDSTLPIVEKFIRSCEFLTKYPLLRVEIGSGKEETMIGRELKKVQGDGRFLIKTASGDLDITAFLLIRFDPDFNDLLVYETMIGTRAKYIMGNHMAFLDQADEPGNRVNMLKKLVQDVAGEEELEYARQRYKAREELNQAIQNNAFDMHHILMIAGGRNSGFSERVFSEYLADGRYIHETYVPRVSIGEAYRKLLDKKSNKNALVVVADSGVGKSTEICQLFRRELSGDIVFILSGRTIRSHDVLEDIRNALIGESSRFDLAALFKSIDATRKDERFVILFDGLNETDQPVVAFQQINEFIEKHDFPWLKVIVTCRSYAWEKIESSGLLIDRRRYVLDESGNLANVLAPFSIEEVGNAFTLYANYFQTQYPDRWANVEGLRFHEVKLLSSPLILRLLFEAYKEDRVPDELDLDVIMCRFSDQKLRPRDRNFLESYLMAFYFQESTDILDTNKLLGLNRDEAMQHSEESIEESVAKLIEHICSEQVYDIDEVWLCDRPGCPKFEEPQFVEDENGGQCSCGQWLKRKNVDNRSTFSRLLSENILSSSEADGHMLVRLVLDKYFEYLMKRYILKERIQDENVSEVIDLLFQKASNNGIFIEPLKGILYEFWKKDSLDVLLQVANKTDITAYQAVREFFEMLIGADFNAFAKAIREAAYKSNFNINICRAGVHAMLFEPDIAKGNKDRIVELLVFLSRCSSDKVSDEAAEYLVNLRRTGQELDLISPLVNYCGELILRKLTFFRATATGLSKAKRSEFKGVLMLFMNAVLFGLGNFFDDPKISQSVVRNGLKIIQKLLRHPILSMFGKFLARFISSQVAKIYKEKGPLPCNYFEMRFQLESDRDAIRRAGDLFFVEEKNVFNSNYEEFYAMIHSNNGLISWYLLSLIPVHFLNMDDRGRGLDYLGRLMREGNELDRYVVGEALVIIRKQIEKEDERIEKLLDELWEIYLNDPSQLFVHMDPEPAPQFAGEVAEYIQKRVNDARSSGDPFLMPWITLQADQLHRFYINSVVLHCALRALEREETGRLDDLLTVLERSIGEDLLRSVHSKEESSLFVMSFLIKALGMAGMFGYMNEALATIKVIINKYFLKKDDISKNLSDAQKNAMAVAVVEALKSIKDFHREEVLHFVDAFDLNTPELSFLSEVKTAVVEKEKLFSKSMYGHNIYQGAFSTKAIREKFGEFTKSAANAKSVEDFFLVYTQGFLNWMKQYSLNAQE